MCSANGADGNGMPWRSNISRRAGFARAARLANPRAPRCVQPSFEIFRTPLCFRLVPGDSRIPPEDVLSRFNRLQNHFDAE